MWWVWLCWCRHVWMHMHILHASIYRTRPPHTHTQTKPQPQIFSLKGKYSHIHPRTHTKVPHHQCYGQRDWFQVISVVEERCLANWATSGLPRQLSYQWLAPTTLQIINISVTHAFWCQLLGPFVMHFHMELASLMDLKSMGSKYWFFMAHIPIIQIYWIWKCPHPTPQFIHSPMKLVLTAPKVGTTGISPMISLLDNVA